MAKNQTWEVVVWSNANECLTWEFDTRDEAFVKANEYTSAYAIEIYGPNGEYETA